MFRYEQLWPTLEKREAQIERRKNIAVGVLIAGSFALAALYHYHNAPASKPGVTAPAACSVNR